MRRTVGTIGSVAAPAWGRLLLLAGLLAAAALTVQLGYGQTPGGDQETVDDVIIVGLHSISPQQVKASLRTMPGQPYNPATVQEDLTRLGAMKTFKTPRVDFKRNQETKTITVYFIVEEYPNLVRDIVFKYAHHTKPEELEAITGLKRGLPLNPDQNRRACFAITDYYRKDGRFFASCKLEEGGNPSDTRVVFNVTEGPVVRIRYISFTGNDTLATSPRLRQQVDTWQRFMGVELFSSKFNPAGIEQDTAKLEEYYKTNGYLDARVTRELQFTDDHQFVDIVFHITEGLRYHVQGTAVKGAQFLPQDQVLSILQIHKGDTYDERVVEKDVRNITDLYGYRGFPVVVQKDLVFADPKVEPGVVRINYQIIERKKRKAGEIVVVGNEITKQRVVEHFLDGILPGQDLSYPAMRDAEKKLARSNLFDQESKPTVSVIERNDNPDSEYADVLVNVKETMTGSLMFGASINSDAGLVGSIVLNERNFDLFRPPTSIDDIWQGRAWRGGGEEFRIEAVPGTEVQRYSASFREPFLFDMPYSLSDSIYYYQRTNDEDLETRIGFKIALGHQFDRYWSANIALRLENVNVSNVPYYAPIDYLSVQGNNLVVAPSITIARDDRDSFLRPTEGSLVSFTYEQLLGDFTSPILNLSASRYFTIWQRPDQSGRQVLMFRSQVGWAGDDTPVFERFFAGGIQSLRGFEYRGVGPIIDGFNIGGDFMFLNSVEYQVPVLANDMLYLVGFVDSGTVEQTAGIHDYRVSAGVGLRISVPMLGQVPIALDFGFPIVRDANDRTQMFSFYVGVFK